MARQGINALNHPVTPTFLSLVLIFPHPPVFDTAGMRREDPDLIWRKEET